MPAKASGADTFVAFSYPPDTFGLSGTAVALAYNPPAFYTAVGTAFPVYKDQIMKGNVEGVLGIGGVNPDDPKYQAYAKRHMEVTGQEPDCWASPVTYASLEMLQQAIERVGKIDRAAIINEMRRRHLRHRRRHHQARQGRQRRTSGGPASGRTASSTAWRRRAWARPTSPIAPKPAWKPAQ